MLLLQRNLLDSSKLGETGRSDEGARIRPRARRRETGRSDKGAYPSPRATLLWLGTFLRLLDIFKSRSSKLKVILSQKKNNSVLNALPWTRKPQTNVPISRLKRISSYDLQLETHLQLDAHVTLPLTFRLDAEGSGYESRGSHESRGASASYESGRPPAPNEGGRASSSGE